MIRVAIIQHEKFEGLGIIDFWLKERGIEPIMITPQDENYPDISEFDLLTVLGGPMSANDSESWIAREKQFIEEAIAGSKYIVGLCLGGQMIASALGANIIKSPDREVGYHTTYRIPFSEKYNDLIATIPPEFPAFHWHSEMFEIPEGAKLFATTEGCPNQAFMYSDRVVGLQFHLETTPTAALELIENCGNDLKYAGRFISNSEDISEKRPKRDKKMNGILLVMLDTFLAKIVMGS